MAWPEQAQAGGGGMAGAAAFSLDANGNVTGVAVSAAVGGNGAAAWAFNNGTSNSAGAIGSNGTITLINFNSSIVEQVFTTPRDELMPEAPVGGFDIQLGTTSGDAIIGLN
ncbi:hypothetical protein IQ225_14005 [Synechocystis salina LEGE 06155]|nr:hypothetical protein [Synechocystis salina LEGE 06155]